LLDDVGWRANEREPSLFTGTSKVGSLCEEAVTRVDGVRLRLLRRREERGNGQVALRRRRWTDTHRTISDAHMMSVGIRVRVDRDALGPCLVTSPRDPYRNFAAICDQHSHCVDELRSKLSSPDARRSRRRP
jgi:hypothetical protein